MKYKRRLLTGFTLIELLIVVGVVAILSVAVVMALNPTQLMAQGRDATRLNDLDTLNHALTLYGAERSAFGSPNTIYVSVPDPTIATTNGTSTCSGIGLSTTTLPAGWTYQCASTSSVQDVDGTGWLPVNFTQITSKPLSQLPIDPINTTSSGNYYTYVTNGSQWELTSIAESQKYKSQTNSKTPFQPGLLAQGSNLTLSPIFNSQGLIGYWNFDEGSGTIVKDLSGNGNNATFSGTTPYYTGGKLGPYAGNFDGSSDYAEIPGFNNAPSSFLSFSAAAWFKTGSNGDLKIFSQIMSTSTGLSWSLLQTFNSNLRICIGFCQAGTSNVADNTWHFAAVVGDGASIRAYLDGRATPEITIPASSTSTAGVYDIGAGRTPGLQYYFSGSIDDLRYYNRPLSISEIQALYNATK